MRRSNVAAGTATSFVWLVIIAALQILALVVFMLGFFLTRQEVPHYSHCQDATLWEIPIYHNLSKTQPGVDGICWSKPRFTKAVIIVIDALRFDFVNPFSEAEYGELTTPSKLIGYHLNKLPVVRELMTSDPTRALLYRFEADPPTTTMQRLKGLTTGSLPTFIDLRKNFHSPSIAEDNLIRQLQQQGKRLTAMGDDTWQLLFPDAFNHSFPFPSFNTRDLDTVDNGVLQHLMPELLQGDWDVLIAHFLGVDHVGHTFGPSHPAMECKLTQMDAALRKVIEALEDDSLLLLMGDHGMTDDGNHGGATVEETEAALFIHAKGKPLVSQAHDDDGNSGLLLWTREVAAGGEKGRGSQQGLTQHTLAGGAVPRRVAQVDLVPTLALLLGTAIPYANLGGIIPELFYHPDESYAGLAAKFYANCIQLNRYLQKYAELASLPSDNIDLLERMIEKALKNHRSALALDAQRVDSQKAKEALLKQACSDYRQFLDEALDLGRRVWTQYDVELMLWAVVLLLTSLLWSFCLTSSMKMQSIGSLHQVMTWGLCGVGLALILSLSFPSHFLAENRTLVIPCLVSSITFLGLSSSSGLSTIIKTNFRSLSVKEVASLALVLLHGVSLFSNSYIEAEEKTYVFLASASRAVFLLNSEDQQKQKMKKEVDDDGDSYKDKHAWSSASLSPLFRQWSPLFFRQWQWLLPALLTRLAFEQKGHGQDIGAHFSLLTTAVPLGLLLIGYQQWTNCIRSSIFLGLLYALMLVYWTSQADPYDTRWSEWLHLGIPRLLYLLVIGAIILRLLLLPPSTAAAAAATATVASQKNHCGPELSAARRREVGHRCIFIDLAAITSAIIMLVLGPSSPLSLLCMIGSLLSFRLPPPSSSSLLSQIIMLSLYGRAYFYATGHHNQFNRLQYSAAFIGFDDFDFITGGILLFLNTFGTELLALLLFAHHFTPPFQPTYLQLLQALFTFLNLSTFRTLFTSICVIIQRRHLMVWAIFAPKFIFDAALHTVLSIFSCLICTIVFISTGGSSCGSSGEKWKQKESTD